MGYTFIPKTYGQKMIHSNDLFDFEDRLKDDGFTLGDKIFINEWQFLVIGNDLKFRANKKAYLDYLIEKEKSRLGFADICNLFWDNIKVPDCDGNHIEVGDIVLSSDSDDWDTECTVINVTISIYEYSRYMPFVITEYTSGPSKEFKLYKKKEPRIYSNLIK